MNDTPRTPEAEANAAREGIEEAVLRSEAPSREAQISEAVKLVNAFESFLRSEGWTLLDEILHNHQDQRMAKIFEPAGGIDGAMLKEYMIASAATFRFVRALPRQILDDAKSTLDMVEKEKEDAARRTDAGNGELGAPSGDGDSGDFAP